ncbi:MAG: VOC family protein [Alphaproteobacteria bacterium]
MKLAKPCFDVGLATNIAQPMLNFWTDEAGLPYDHLLKVGKGQHQHRFDCDGSVVKVNNYRDPLPDTPPTGYREVWLAHEGAEKALTDPDGNKVRLVRSGHQGVTQLAMRVGVRSLAAHSQFFREAFGFDEVPYEGGVGFKVGNGLLLLEESADAPSDAVMQGKGWRYITFQVFKVDEDHAAVLAAGGREAMAPTTLGKTARISMVRDPDGNWIELSQRASLVGALD